MEKFKIVLAKGIWTVFFLLPLIDIANGFLLQSGLFVGNSSQLLKGLLLGLLFIFWLSKKQKVTVALLGIYLLLISFLHSNGASQATTLFIQDVIYFTKILAFPLAIWGISSLLNKQQSDKREKLLTILLYTSWFMYALSTVLTLFGFGDTQYASGGGLKGYFYGGNEFALTYFVISALILGLVMKDSREKGILFGIIMLVVSIIIGMKTAMLGTGLALLLSFFLLPKTDFRQFFKKYFIVIPPLLVVLLIGGIYILKEQNFFYRLQYLTDMGALSFVTGERSPIAKTALSIYKDEYTLQEKLFGTGKIVAEKRVGEKYLGTGKVRSTEMDPVDILLIGGIFTFLMVYIPWIYWLIKMVQNRKILDSWGKYAVGLSFIILFISTLAGHVIYSGIVLFYVAILLGIKNTSGKRETSLVFIGPMSNGGIKTYMSQTAARLRMDGLSVTIVNTHFLEKGKTILQFPLVIIKVLLLLFDALVLNKRIILHYHTATRGSYFRKLLLALLFYPFADMQILHLHSGETSAYFTKLVNSKILHFSLALFILLFDKVIVVSETVSRTTKEALSGGNILFNRKQWSVLPNAIALPKELPEPPKFNGGTIKILFVGRFEEAKNIPGLLEIAKELQERKVPAILTLVGDGSEYKWAQQEIEKHQITNIELKGWVQHSEIDLLYQNHHLFLIPSRFESFGIVVLEAYKNGLPALASNVGGLNDIVIHSKTGFTFDVSDIAGFVDKISYLTTHPNELVSLQKNAQEFVRQFDYAEHITKLISIYSI